MIEIKNLRNEKCIRAYQFRVDRASVLGNKFIMHNESEREQVIMQYKIWLWQNRERADIKKFMHSMIQAWKEYGKLELFCWCAPKPCHAEVIRDYLLWLQREEIADSEIACANCGEVAIIGKRCGCGYIN